MERCDYKSALKQDRYRNSTTTREHHPSFSSTLLDSIYRSIDENNNNNNGQESSTEQELIFYRETMRKKHNNNNNNYNNKINAIKSSKEEDLANLKRACLIEKWMEKKKISCSTDKVVVARRKSMPDFNRNSLLMNSSSSSNSDSSFSGGLSSSEAESIYGVINSNRRSSNNLNNIQKPKPIRTSVSSEKKARNECYDPEIEQVHWRKINHDSSSSSSNNHFVKTKSRALKIYSDLKKAKQPISPGGRLSTFLNSLFAHGNSKKGKISTVVQYDTNSDDKNKSKSAYSSTTCSSASSFSRSCLSKTPSSSSGKVINGGGGAKRSVRFYPVSVIVDEDCQPVGHKSLREDDQLGFIAVKNNVQTSMIGINNNQNARDVMENYQRINNGGDFDMKDVTEEASDDDDDDDDDASCASSDLFELDNLATIGIDRYSEELPVYETTHFGMNRAIAKGLFV